MMPPPMMMISACAGRFSAMALLKPILTPCRAASMARFF